jgi:hypothetical protein
VKGRSKGRARTGTTPPVIPGGVVRDLVDRNEKRIEELERELAAAVREAQEAELRVAILSGSEHPVQPGPRAPGSNGTSTGGNGHGAGRPRTTVVTRPRPTEAG